MTTFALDNLWNYLQGLSLSQSDREWLANKLLEPTEKPEPKTDFSQFAGTWADMDNEMLDEALAKFSGDWGGNGDAMEIARGLRQGADMVRDVQTW